MGSELVGILITGPVRLTFKHPKKKLIKLLEGNIEKVRHYIKNEYKENIKWPLKWVHDTEHLSDIVHFNPNGVLENFIKLYSGKSSFSDVIIHTAKIPKRGSMRVIFAGDTSYGDEPQGEGYQIIRQADLLGVLQNTVLW